VRGRLCKIWEIAALRYAHSVSSFVASAGSIEFLRRELTVGPSAMLMALPGWGGVNRLDFESILKLNFISKEHRGGRHLGDVFWVWIQT